MKFHADCISCLLNKAMRNIEGFENEELRLGFARGICRIMDSVDPEHDSSPLVDARIFQFKREYLNMEDDYTEIKHRFNGLVMGLYDRLLDRVQASPDPLRAAIQLSMAGNYIDFGVLDNIEPEDVLKLLDEAAGRSVDADELARLRQDLERGGELVFLHDNCGEVVLDKLLIETIRACYPGKKIVSVVRGNPVQNDATMDDAREIGLTGIVEVVENGTMDIAGTQIDMLPDELRRRIEAADLVIAKGQGNFETLLGCGLNVYFLFLSKCPSYTKWYGFERFSGILKNDLRIQQ